MNAFKRTIRTLFCTASLLAAALVAGCGGGGDQGRDPILGVPAAQLQSLTVTPPTASVAVGASQQFVATATYTDGSARDVTASSAWSSATPALASVNAGNGLAAGVATGSVLVSATFGGKSGAATLTVTAALATLTPVTLRVTPASASVAVGAIQQFVATATYSDGSSAIVSNSAGWSSLASATATVAPGGAATGVTVGSTGISASYGMLTASAALTVTAGATPPAAVSVNLGSAASFAVLAGTALTSASGGTTLITGDVGSPSQTVAPPVAPGYTDYTSGPILAGALADLQIAIVDANSRVCDINFAGNIDLGGQTLPPGVYCYAGSISITGTLKLSGAGVYIFRSALTLNSTANSTVQLINGASAADVSWLPVGATTLGANSVFIGTVLGQSGAITVGDNATLLNGRVLSGAAVTLSNNQIAK